MQLIKKILVSILLPLPLLLAIAAIAYILFKGIPFRFQYWGVLFLLIAPLGLGFWEVVHKGHPVSLPFDHGVQKPENWWHNLVICANLYPYCLLAIAIMAIAGPQTFGPPEKERELTNIEFCLDVSGSMTAGFGDGSRYDGAMQAIKDFTTYRKGDAFGLTIFGNEVLHWVPLTKDVSAIQLATPFLQPGKLPPWYGGTSIGKALRACRKLLAKRKEGDRMIVLVSDGQSSDLYGGRAEEIAAELKEDKIVVYSIHVADSAPPADLYTISNNTGGDVFGAGDPEALSFVFKHIDKMQKSNLKRKSPAAIDIYWPLAIVGMTFVLLYIIYLFGLRYTPW